jgi:hypothetical protein
MGDMPTAVRAFFTRRLDPTTVFSYALVLSLIIAVLVTGTMIVANQLNGL